MKDTRAIGILLILFIATLCPAEGAQLVTIDSKDYTSLDTATEGYFYVKLDDSPSNVVLNFDIKFEALSFVDPKNKNFDDIAKYADFYYCRTNDNSNDDSTLKNYNYIKISDYSISNLEIVDETAILNYSFMISKQKNFPDFQSELFNPHEIKNIIWTFLKITDEEFFENII